MRKKIIYCDMNGKVDRFATWVNNSPACWLILLVMFILCGIIEGL